MRSYLVYSSDLHKLVDIIKIYTFDISLSPNGGQYHIGADDFEEKIYGVLGNRAYKYNYVINKSVNFEIILL